LTPTWTIGRWTILGLLVEESDYAYHLAQRYDVEAERFPAVLPPLKPSSVDKHVKQLASEGYVEVQRRVPVGRNRAHHRVVYEATVEGTRTHKAWVIREFQQHPQRADLLQRWSGTTDRDRLQLLQAYRRECLGQLETLPPPLPLSEEQVARLSRVERMNRHAALYERIRLEADLEFVTTAIAELKAAVRHAAKIQTEIDDRAAVA
jgi:DNA-binding PadR family transcriptional regulator